MNITLHNARDLPPDLIEAWAHLVRDEPALDHPLVHPEWTMSAAAGKDIEVAVLREAFAKVIDDVFGDTRMQKMNDCVQIMLRRPLDGVVAILDIVAEGLPLAFRLVAPAHILIHEHISAPREENGCFIRAWVPLRAIWSAAHNYRILAWRRRPVEASSSVTEADNPSSTARLIPSAAPFNAANVGTMLSTGPRCA